MSAAIVALAIGLGAIASSLQAQTPPAPGTPKDFRLPATTDFRLGNGLAVTLVPYGTIPKVLVQLRVGAGAVEETADQVWLAELVGDLLKEGTASRDAETIARTAAGMGGRVEIEVGPDQAIIGVEALQEFAPGAVALVSDVARHPSFRPAEVARVKADRLRQLSIERSQPQPIGRELFLRLMYPGHPYGRLYPTEARLGTYTPEELRTFHAANYGARRAHLYVVGRFDSRKTEAAIRQALAGWASGSAATPKPPSPVSQGKIHLINRPGAPQSTLFLGLPVVEPGHEDFLPLLITDALLGGSFTSRITQNIREDKGYTYSPRSSVSTRVHDAYWAEVADVTTEVTGASLKEIRHEIDSLRAAAPPAEELKAVQAYVAGLFVLQNSTRDGIAEQLSFTDRQGIDRGYLTGFVTRIRRVTPSDINRIARSYLRPDEMTLVIVGDRARVDRQVTAYGPIAP